MSDPKFYCRTEDLAIGYGKTPLMEHIGLGVGKGTILTLIGPNGAGKSTLLKLLLREELPSEGKVTVLGKDVARLHRHQVPYLRRQMGVVFQDFRLIPTMTVYENVAFAMRVTNISTKKIRDRVPFALSLVGLEDKMDRLPDELSGGEQQRVAIARALINNPSTIIADEPTGNLDSKTSAEVLGLIKRTSAEFRQTVVMITHNNDIARLADRIVRIEDGKIVE